ncbi:hypothetical protein SDC9_42966 [bioreactor metagenome]|uniref:Lipoprotein n=1 Tax=bioreactor metagenome TaxID=1076179 RepID=A0A644W2S7_9ZZZZ|nr:hypothetical protein [Paludibacter sp.]
MKTHFPKQIILNSTLMIISVLTIFVFSSCNKEEIVINNDKKSGIDISDDENNKNDNNTTVVIDNYYFKYVISATYPYIFSNWSVATPEGNYTKNNYQTRRWEETYGPVKRGFKCEVQVKNGQPTISIYVSKNQEPFTLKTTVDGYYASYTIDF